ncbi:MAG: hypothetical protein KIT09_24175 [Bryobacteraceae bacterium]|nr:hypothetical protein [Bryobacteraceae bacterium]
MLYDWNAWDATAGKYVYQMVDDDLAWLSQNGFNLLHLYLWDQQILRSLAPNEPAGFLSAPSSPNLSPNGQWQALGEFVSKAQNKGLFVALHFVSGYVTSTLNLPPAQRVPPETIAQNFIPWAGAFIQYLTPGYRNVLMWGLIYSVGAIAGHPENDWSVFSKLAYKGVDDIAVSSSPSPGVLGLIGVNSGMDMVDTQFVDGAHPRGEIPWGTITARNAGYTWDWRYAQQTAKTWRDLLTAAYGYAKDPDIYMMLLYEPNSWDLWPALNSLSNGYVAGGIPVPANKIFVAEFATSSSLAPSPNGNNSNWLATFSPSSAQGVRFRISRDFARDLPAIKWC